MQWSWVIDIFRQSFFRQNLLLIVLRILKVSERSEWEILEEIHSQCGWTPNAKEFRVLCNLMRAGGFIDVEFKEGGHRLQITTSGAMLLERLEDEFRAIVAELASSRPLLTR